MKLNYFMLGFTLIHMITTVAHRFGCPADSGSLVWLLTVINFLAMAAITLFVEVKKL